MKQLAVLFSDARGSVQKKQGEKAVSLQWLSNFLLYVYTDTDVPVCRQLSAFRDLSSSLVSDTDYPPHPPSLRNLKLRGSRWNPKHEVVTGLNNPSLDSSLEELLLCPTSRLAHMPSLWNYFDLLFCSQLVSKVLISSKLSPFICLPQLCQVVKIVLLSLSGANKIVPHINVGDYPARCDETVW